MVTQINPVGSSPIASAAVSPTPVAAQPPTNTQVASSPAPSAGSEATAVAQVNQHLQQAQTGLKLQVDPSSGRTVFQIVQQGTGQVLMQIPSVEVLGMSSRIRAMEAQNKGSGALVDKES
jgi:uncharacterized FlaG/YvyC family protein